MSMETLVAFGLISGIIFAGFVGELIFRRIGIPSVLLLLALGYILGPIFHQLDVDTLKNIRYIVGPLALVILLFDGGIRLNIYDLVHGGWRGVLMAILVTVLSILVVGGIWAALGYDFMMGAVLGAIVGGTTSTMVIAIVNGMQISEKAKQFILIDAALTDVLAVILTISLMSIIITHSASVQGTGKEILGSFSTGGLIGGVLGLAWIALSRQLSSINFFYMLTLAILLLSYVVSEYFGGSGAIAALVFGVMLGNYREIGQMLRFRNVADDAPLFTFQNEIGFLVRVFYFVYLGALVVIGSAYSVLVGLLVMGGLAVARIVSTYISTYGSDLAQYRSHINTFMPRGLAAAVMGTYPLTVLLENQGVIPAEAYNQLLAQANLFVEISFVVIVASVILTTIGVLLVRRSDAAREREEKKNAEDAGEKGGEGGEPETGNGKQKEGEEAAGGKDVGREGKKGAEKQKGH